MVRIFVICVSLCVFSSAALAQFPVGSALATTVATLDSTLFAAYNA